MSKEFNRIDALFNKKLETLKQENISTEELETQKEILEEERQLQKDIKEETIKTKEKNDILENKKQTEINKKLEKTKSDKEIKENLKDIDRVNKQKETIQKQHNSNLKKETRQLKAFEYMVGRQGFELQKKADLTSANINYLKGLSDIISAYARFGGLGLVLGASHSALLTATYSQSRGLIQARQYPPPMAFAEGGLVEGGIKGVDSVPALLQQGEVIVPTKNFDDLKKGFVKDKVININNTFNFDGDIQI